MAKTSVRVCVLWKWLAEVYQHNSNKKKCHPCLCGPRLLSQTPLSKGSIEQLPVLFLNQPVSASMQWEPMAETDLDGGSLSGGERRLKG